MKYIKFLMLAVMLFSLGVHAADPPAAATYRVLNDKLLVFGTDNQFQLSPDSGDSRLEIRDAAGNVLGRVSDAGTTGVIGFVQHDVINGSVASQITSAATANRAVTLPDAAGEISLLGQTIATGEIVDGTIVNADVSASAAIAATKLNAGTNGQAIVTAGGVSGWGTVPSAGITDDTIVNADINSAAAIAITKLSTVGASADYVLTYNGSAIVWAANAGGSIEGAGPLVDGAIPRMDGTGGDTLQGYSSNTITASDAGLLTVPGGMLVQDDMEIEAASILLSDSADLYFARDDEIRWDVLYTTGSETGISGETSLAFDAYDNDGNFLRRALQLNRTASEGVVIGTVAAPSPLYVKGDIYAHTSDAQIVDDGKVLLSALAQTSATTGQVLQWNGSTWAPASSSVNWASPGEIGSVTPNVGSFTTLYASSLDLSTPLPDAEVADTLTIGASSTVADGALSANVAHVNAVETIASDWVNTANPWADNEVADTLTASIFKGSGTTTDAVDLATAEVAGVLPDANVNDTLTIGASSTVNDSALSANVAHVNAVETIASNWVNTANPWADNEVSDTLTASVLSANYVASVANGSGISGGGAGSNAAALTLALGALTGNWDQTGAFDISLNNASSELKILESAGATFFGIFDVTDLGADRTYTFPNVTGTVVTTGDTASVTGTMITNDTVALTTDTSGNYVTSVATSTGLTGGASASEGATLTLSLSHLGFQSLTDPNADRIAFWDDSAGAFAWLTAGTGLTITDTTISASGGGGQGWREWDTSEMYPHNLAPCASAANFAMGTSLRMYRTLAFDATSDEIATFYWQVPEDFNASSPNIDIYIYWEGTVAGGPNTVRWEINAVADSHSGPLNAGAASPTTTVCESDSETDNDINISVFTNQAAIGNTPAAGDHVYFQITRNADHANDDMSGDANLLGIAIAYNKS